MLTKVKIFLFLSFSLSGLLCASTGEAISAIGSLSSIISVTVISPNGGEQLEIGSEYQVRWIASNVADVSIEYSVDEGNTWAGIIDSIPSAAGQYIWVVPNSASRFRVTQKAPP